MKRFVVLVAILVVSCAMLVAAEITFPVIGEGGLMDGETNNEVIQQIIGKLDEMTDQEMAEAKEILEDEGPKAARDYIIALDD